MLKQPENKQNVDQTQILVLDDEPSIRWVMDRTLSQAGYIPRLAAMLKKLNICLKAIRSVWLLST